MQVIPPGTSGCTGTANCTIASIPAHGQRALYPSNQANYLSAAAAFDFTKHVHIMGTVTPGWLRQNDPFLPYTANTAITGLGPLPAEVDLDHQIRSARQQVRSGVRGERRQRPVERARAFDLHGPLR